MCWQCDHPEATRQDYLDYMQDLIDQFGWAVVGVEGDRIHPPWAYTLGLTRYGIPELVVTGLPAPRASWLLNTVAPYVLEAKIPEPGDEVFIEGCPAMEVVGVSEPSAHLTVAVEFYGQEIQALQLTYPDERGHWPWHRGFRGQHRGGQPVLGVRAAALYRRSPTRPTCPARSATRSSCLAASSSSAISPLSHQHRLSSLHTLWLDNSGISTRKTATECAKSVGAARGCARWSTTDTW